jgi:hypothetical protein
MINFNRIINDETHYLWSKMAEDNDAIVNFIDNKTREKWVAIIEKDVKEFGENETFLLSLLKYFEHLHWIRLENETDLIFQIRLSKEKNKEDYDFLLNHLSKYAKLTQEDERFYLEETLTYP